MINIIYGLLRIYIQQIFSIMSSIAKTKILKNLDQTTYFVNGKKHRLDGPAVESPLVKEWWVNGKRHREDGPAVYYYDKLEWWLNGKRHCTNGPAVEDINGDKEWWVDGKPHREDGPAIEYNDGYKEWWIEGKFIESNE